MFSNEDNAWVWNINVLTAVTADLISKLCTLKTRSLMLCVQDQKYTNTQVSYSILAL